MLNIEVKVIDITRDYEYERYLYKYLACAHGIGLSTP